MFAPRSSILRAAVLGRRQVIVMPLWGLYHGRGQDLIDELDALGEGSYMLMQSGPLFGDVAVFEESGPN